MPNTAKGTPYVVSTDLVANYPTVSSDLADHIDDNLAYNAVTINAQTGTTYTFALADASEGKLVTASNAASSTYTVPPQSSVTWANGAVLRILNQGAGIVTIAAGSGVTINGTPLTLAQYRGAAIQRTASNTWTFVPFSGGVGNADFSDAATGTYTDGNGVAWKYKDYSASGNLTISTAGLIEVMVLAGGAGGAGATSGAWGGAGGSGGYVGFGTFTNARAGALFLSAATYTVTVGGGGAGGASGNNGSFGNDSRLGDIYAHRGAPGTPGSSNNTLKGGSGGGGASAGAGIPGQGNDGAGLGGGQAGAGGGIGGAASTTTGGAGLAINITGSSVTYGTGGSVLTTYTAASIGGGGDGYAGSIVIAGDAGGAGRVIVRVRTN